MPALYQDSTLNSAEATALYQDSTLNSAEAKLRGFKHSNLSI